MEDSPVVTLATRAFDETVSTAAAKMDTVDANDAVASIAYRLSEVIAIYPITPASAMGEHADEWAAHRRPNLWGAIPTVVEMQSEAGAAGAVHGALQGGALVTTFTASQGLLLMLPNLYKIAGELTSCCIHVAARSLATHALSIFGDHSDVMAARGTGWALLASGSPQEAQDLAAIGHAATLVTRVPFLHFFDGFRTSHEIQKIANLDDDTLSALIDTEAIAAHRDRALDPNRPVARGTSQNPDSFFQGREAANQFYDRCPDAVSETMDRFAALTGRQYRLFDYIGHPEAERVIVMMGSGAECAHEAVEALVARGERVGLVKVRLYRPFAMDTFVDALPTTVSSIAVLDRSKEPGATGDPLLLDVTAALADAVTKGSRAGLPRIIGGRYGLGSKEFTPPMVKAALDELDAAQPRTRFTLGINDDVTGLSLAIDDSFDSEPKGVTRAVFYGLGSDGTVSANKASIKIIGDATDHACQGHFVLDSKKAGSTTESHLRFGPSPIRSTYLIRRAGFVAVHDPGFLDRLDVLARADHGATVLLNVAGPADEVWAALPHEAQELLIERGCRLFAIDAYSLAEQHGLGRRINTIMQACFFALSDVLPIGVALAHMKDAAAATWGKRGDEVVRRNFAAIDDAIAALHEVMIPATADATRRRRPGVPTDAPDFVQRVDAAAPRGPRRPASRQCLPARRYLAYRHQPFRETGDRVGDTDLGDRSVRAVQPLFDDLPARRDPHQGVRTGRHPRCTRIISFGSRELHARTGRLVVHRASCPRRLHRLWAVRHRVPCQRPHPAEAQGHQSPAGRRTSRRGTSGLRLLPTAARRQSVAHSTHSLGDCSARTALRVLRRLLGLW